MTIDEEKLRLQAAKDAACAAYDDAVQMYGQSHPITLHKSAIKAAAVQALEAYCQMEGALGVVGLEKEAQAVGEEIADRYVAMKSLYGRLVGLVLP